LLFADIFITTVARVLNLKHWHWLTLQLLLCICLWLWLIWPMGIRR